MLTLQIHLTEPCLILPGAHLNSPFPPPPNQGHSLRSDIRSGSTAINLNKQRQTLGNNVGNLSNRWSTAEPNHVSETGNMSAASTAELTSEKTSMLRGFVVLHLSESINLNRLSIRFSGTTNTTGPDPTALVAPCNNTILTSEEYTIQDSALIPSEDNAGAPPYSSDSRTSLTPALSFDPHPSSHLSNETPTENQPSPSQCSKRNSTGVTFCSHNLSNYVLTEQSPSQSVGERRTSQSNASVRSSLSLASGVSRYFHRRSRSTSPLGKNITIPLEVDMQVRNPEEQLSSFVMVNKFPEDLAPMYQDSVFNMLANQYNLLGEEGLLHSDQPQSPSYEAHYHSIISPEKIEDGYTRICLAAAGLNQKEMHSLDNASEIQKCDRSRKSKNFKDNIGNLFGALKPRRYSFSSTVGLGKAAPGNMSSNCRNLSGKPPQSSRPHFLVGHPTTKLTKSPDISKKQQDFERRYSNPTSCHKLAWGRYLPRRRSSSKKNFSKRNGIQNVERNTICAAGSGEQASSEDVPLATDDPFGISDYSLSGVPTASEPKKTTSRLKPGVHKYPIVVPVPNHLPPSLIGDHGSISYSLEAILTYEELDDPTLLTTHQQIPIDLVDPAAGSPSLNPPYRIQLSGEEDALNEVFSSYSGINIDRSWEDQLYYQIRMDTRKFLVGGKVGFEIQFNPLSPMKIYKFVAEVEQKTQYFMDHEKTYLRHCESHSFPLVKLEQTSPVVLINQETNEKFAATRLRASDVPLLPIIAADPVFVKNSPLLPYIKLTDCGQSNEVDRSLVESQAISQLSNWSEHSGPWTLKFDLRLPGCRSSCKLNTTKGASEVDVKPEQARGLNFTCLHSRSPIVVKHYLKLRMRVERGDDAALDKRGRRKKYDIILSSPIQILSCRCKPYSLPAYASSDPADLSEILSIFKQINAAQEKSAPSLQCNCIARVE